MINDYPLIMVLWNLFLAILPFGFFWLLKKYWQANKFKTIKNKKKFVFLNKQEEMLAAKYGVPYLEYKKMVKF